MVALPASAPATSAARSDGDASRYGDSVAVAWTQTTAAEHREKLAAAVNMKDPKAVMSLPRVGQSEILMRAGAM